MQSASTLNFFQSQLNYLYLYSNLYEAYDFDGSSLKQVVVYRGNDILLNNSLDLEFEITGNLNPELSADEIIFKNNSDEVIVRMERPDIEGGDQQNLVTNIELINNSQHSKILRVSISKQAIESATAVPILPLYLHVFFAAMVLMIASLQNSVAWGRRVKKL